MVNAGQLNRRIQIQQQTTTQDAFGQQQQTWTTIYTCWASISVQKSQLAYSTTEFLSKVTQRITIRWTPSVVIEANMRIIYQQNTPSISHTLNIEAVLDTDSQHQEIVILAYELNSPE